MHPHADSQLVMRWAEQAGGLLRARQQYDRLAAHPREVLLGPGASLAAVPVVGSVPPLVDNSPTRVEYHPHNLPHVGPAASCTICSQAFSVAAEALPGLNGVALASAKLALVGRAPRATADNLHEILKAALAWGGCRRRHTERSSSAAAFVLPAGPGAPRAHVAGPVQPLVGRPARGGQCHGLDLGRGDAKRRLHVPPAPGRPGAPRAAQTHPRHCDRADRIRDQLHAQLQAAARALRDLDRMLDEESRPARLCQHRLCTCDGG
mmetsp:Transcript_94784/g.292215  ORF Transcript_94784/g.292215 Transcript_94784/m.292215 type:complete len:264 (-) Transcript_94784:576-1367(-)